VAWGDRAGREECFLSTKGCVVDVICCGDDVVAGIAMCSLEVMRWIKDGFSPAIIVGSEDGCMLVVELSKDTSSKGAHHNMRRTRFASPSPRISVAGSIIILVLFDVKKRNANSLQRADNSIGCLRWLLEAESARLFLQYVICFVSCLVDHRSRRSKGIPCSVCGWTRYIL